MKNISFRLTNFVCGRNLLLVILATALLTGPAFAQQSPARRAGGNDLSSRLEANLGKSLTSEQREQIGEASKESAEKLKSLQKEFVGKIAKAVKLAESDIQPMMPKIGEPNSGFDKNMIPKLEAKLDRKLTANELAAVRKADDAKKSAMKPVQDKFAKRLAQITGLPVETVREMLLKVGL